MVATLPKSSFSLVFFSRVEFVLEGRQVTYQAKKQRICSSGVESRQLTRVGSGKAKDSGSFGKNVVPPGPCPPLQGSLGHFTWLHGHRLHSDLHRNQAGEWKMEGEAGRGGGCRRGSGGSSHRLPARATGDAPCHSGTHRFARLH